MSGWTTSRACASAPSEPGSAAADVAYFERLGERRFRATEHTGGAWDRATQHIAPALGLLAHAVEHDREVRRSDGLVLTRLGYDILGTVPIAEVEITVAVVRPGRTIELVEAVLVHADRPVVRLRAWLMQQRDTSAIAGTGFSWLPPPDDVEPWDPTTVWRGGFIATAEVRRRQVEPGRALVWVRTDQPLLADEPVSRTAAVAGLLDIANGMSVRAAPEDVAFPNVDLTAHLVAPPADGWLGLDTTVSFGAAGVGLTTSVVHDEGGPIGTSTQCLTVRPTSGGVGSET
jgi:Thioesterase-like superfamily